MKENKDQSKYELSDPQETQRKWIKPDFKISTLKDAMSGGWGNMDDTFSYS